MIFSEDAAVREQESNDRCRPKYSNKVIQAAESFLFRHSS